MFAACKNLSGQEDDEEEEVVEEEEGEEEEHIEREGSERDRATTA